MKKEGLVDELDFVQPFFFNFLLIFALHYYIGFCHSSTWVSHRHTYVPSLLNLPPISHPSHPSRLSQKTRLSSLCNTANFHWLPILHMVIIHFHATLSIHPILSFSLCVLKSILYVCVSIAALQVGPSVPSFQIPYICVNMQYMSFSFWLTSLSTISSRFIHLIRTDSNVLNATLKIDFF